MTEDSENKNKSVIGLALHAAAADDSDKASESFGNMLPPLPPLESYLKIFKLIILLTVVAFALLAVFFGALVAAKVIVCAIFLALALSCLAVVLYRQTALVNLIELEKLSYLLQQEIELGCIEARQGLNIIQSKLNSAAHPPQTSSREDLLKYVGPLVSMLIKKEKSKLNWAMFGFKIASNVAKIIKQRG